MFRDLLDEEGHVLTHNFRPIQPLGDRVILFNIIDNDDNALDHHNTDDDIPPQVNNDDGNNDLLDPTNELENDNKNVLNELPDNRLDESDTGDRTVNKKTKLDNGSMTHLVSLYLLSMTILASIVSSR